MQAVILAGGLGTRLRPLTIEVPKPMVPVSGVPYLEHQLKLLERQAIRDIVLLTGYLGEQIENYFGDGSRFNLRVRYSRELKPLGTGGALRQAASLLDDKFLIIYGDSFLPIDYAGVYRTLADSPAQGLVVVYDNSLADTSVNNNIALHGDGFVARYDKDSPGDPQLRYVEAGVLAFRREALALLGEQVFSLEKEIFPLLIQSHALLAYPTSQRFYDIGTPERLQEIEQFFRQ